VQSNELCPGTGLSPSSPHCPLIAQGQASTQFANTPPLQKVPSIPEGLGIPEQTFSPYKSLYR
jgi:hypothetical protein